MEHCCWFIDCRVPSKRINWVCYVLNNSFSLLDTILSYEIIPVPCQWMFVHRWNIMCGSKVMALIILQVFIRTTPGCPLKRKLCMRPTVCQSKYDEHSVEKRVCIFGCSLSALDNATCCTFILFSTFWLFQYYGFVRSENLLLLRKLRYFDHCGFGQPTDAWCNRSPSFKVLMHSILRYKPRFTFGSDCIISTYKVSNIKNLCTIQLATSDNITKYDYEEIVYLSKKQWWRE